MNVTDIIAEVSKQIAAKNAEPHGPRRSGTDRRQESVLVGEDRRMGSDRRMGLSDRRIDPRKAQVRSGDMDAVAHAQRRDG